MNFYLDWERDMDNPKYMTEYLAKSEESRQVFIHGEDTEVSQACDLLRRIPMEKFVASVNNMPFVRLAKTNEIPQCGSVEKAICEVPKILAFAPDGLICSELGLKLGAEKQGDAPRKSGEGNGKLAVSLDLATRLPLLFGDGNKRKLGYKISSLGNYLLVFSELDDKLDIISRLLIRECVIQFLIAQAMKGYASYDEAVSSIKSINTRLRRRQNVRKIILIIDSQLGDGVMPFFDRIDWEVKGTDYEFKGYQNSEFI